MRVQEKIELAMRACYHKHGTCTYILLSEEDYKLLIAQCGDRMYPCLSRGPIAYMGYQIIIVDGLKEVVAAPHAGDFL